MTWLCPNAMTGIGGRKHDATAERTAPGEWRIRCSCGYQARASSGEVIEAERRASAEAEDWSTAELLNQAHLAAGLDSDEVAP